MFFLANVAASFAVGGEVSVETVLSGLHHPSGIAVRNGATADRYELFFAESGLGRVAKWSNRERDKISVAVSGFDAGPLSLTFLDPSLLVVGCSSPDGTGIVRAFELPEDGGALGADQAHQTRGIDSAETSPSQQPASCIATTRSRANEHVPDMLVMAVRGRGGQAALYRSRIQAGILAPLQPFAAASPGADTSLATVATSGSGRIVAVYGRRSPVRGVEFVYLNPIDRSTELEYSIDGVEVTDVAYSPTSGSMFVSTSDGRICRVECKEVPAGQKCWLVDVAKIPGASSLAFAPEGALYVTASGNGETDGTLRVLTGDL